MTRNTVIFQHLIYFSGSLIFTTWNGHQSIDLRLSLITSLPWNDTKRGSALPKHLPQIIHQLLRLFMRRKMSTAGMFRFKNDVTGSASPAVTSVSTGFVPRFPRYLQARNRHEFLGEKRYAMWKSRFFSHYSDVG